MTQLRFFLPDEQCTALLGVALAQVLAPRGAGIVYLEGELGAGKSSLARGFLRALGAVGAVRSPTYTLLEPYALDDLTVLHMDLYRLVDPEELHQLGLSDYPPDNSLWLVEWPQRGAGVLPAPEVVIQLAADGEGRTALVEFRGREAGGLAASFTKELAAKLQPIP